ncbi:MAG TPA: amidohydrolase [Pseudidiomarina sp.]|nr:amidohydrolase [Pseudidiomarina sp.]
MKFFAAIMFVVNLFCASQVLAQTVLFHNVNGYTLTGQPGNDAQLQQFSAMLVRDGRIAAIGSVSSIRGAYDFTIDQEISLNNKTVLPGIIDAHGHVLGLGLNLMEVDLRTATSEADAVARVREFAESNPNAEWIVGRGWNQENWPSRSFPTADSLDEAIADRPVYLTRVDGHAAWVNSAALSRATINGATVSPDGGDILRDERGNPSGVLVDNAMYLVEQVMPKTSRELQSQAIELAFQHLLERGITGVHDAGIDALNLDIYKSLADSNKMPVRVYAMLGANEPTLPQLLAAGPYTRADERLTVRSVKIYADGALGSRGAALIEPYHDAPDQRGLLVTSPDQLHDLYQLVIPHGFQINTHAIGDRANRLALDEFARAYATIGGRNLRHRIEHAQVVHPDDLPRFKELNIIASMQPTHATSDKNMAEDRLGKERMQGAYAWNTLLEQGTIIAAGSDFPVELANPFFGLHAAVTRQDRDNQPQGGWYAHESMTLVEALRSFTLDAAYAAGQEETLGSLEPGKWADFIVLDADPFAGDSTTLWDQKVLATYVAGEAVFQR